MDTSHRQVRVLPDPEAVALEAAGHLVRCAAEAVGDRGRFVVALSGGSTPQLLYRLLAGERWRSLVPWEATQVLFADERCVPPDHADSNWRMVWETLLSRVPVVAANVHRMRGEEAPHAAAEAYERQVAALLGPEPRLDLALLGMGADGHTASLFPGTAALEETERLVVANHVPAVGAWRLTMTYRLLSAAADVLFLVTGAAKTQAVRGVLQGSREPRSMPAARVLAAHGRVLWLLDEAAAPKS